MNLPLTNAAQFFAMSRERYNIKLRRDAGQPWPWSSSKIFQEWRFTNVFREDDKTTTWFRNNIRIPLNDAIPPKSLLEKETVLEVLARYEKTRLKLVESTMIFRWFNRIETGEKIKDLLLGAWNTEEARQRLENVHPVVTGAYMIKTFNDMNKLDGILLAIDGGRKILPRYVPRWGATLEGAWKDLQEIDFLGGFMAHEIIQDLRYTSILCNATDINTWGHLGPGAIRGMSWVVYGNEHQFGNSAKNQSIMLDLMRQLLEMSKDPQYWPSHWPAWELHQVEFGLCEFSKFCRAGSGMRQKRRYER